MFDLPFCDADGLAAGVHGVTTPGCTGNLCGHKSGFHLTDPPPPTGWRYNGDSIEILATDGRWSTFSTGRFVDDDAAWLRESGVLRLPDGPDCGGA